MRRHPLAAGALLVGTLAALVLTFNLGGYALWDPDEGRHAEVAREVFSAPTWQGHLVPSFNFQPYRDKPILFYWLVSGVYATAGVGEWQARTVPALAAFGTTLAVYCWAAHAWTVGAGVATGVVLLTALEFAGLGRYVDLDMTFTLWVTLGALAVHRWSVRAAGGERASLVPAAVATALGMLTKGLAAPVLIGLTALAYLLATRQLALLRRAPLVTAALVFVAVAGPWHLAAGLIDPEYLYTFFVHHHFERFIGGARHLHLKPAWFYVPMIVGGFFPWSLLLPATFAGTLGRERRGRPEVFAACWAAVVFGFFSLSRGKLGTYILPTFPPLALLTGRYVSGFMQNAAPNRVERRLVAGAMWGISAFCLTAVPALQVVAARTQRGAWIHTTRLAWVLFPLGIVLAAMLWRGALRRTPVVLACGMLIVLVTFYGWAAPDIGAIYSDAALAAAIEAGSPEVGRAPVVPFGVTSSSLLFYLRRPVEKALGPKPLRSILDANPLVFVVTSPLHVPEILAVRPLEPWVTGRHHVLYATQPPPADLVAQLRARGHYEVGAGTRQ